MSEDDIVWEGERYWVARTRRRTGVHFEVLKHGATASTTIGEAYLDSSVAVARAKYLESRP